MATTPKSGRPRNPATDQAILDATRELLNTVGYAGLTMEAVAARAGVGKPTIYRRYPTKSALVFDAVFGKTKIRSIPDSGEIAADLREAYGWAVDEFAAPEARAALPGLLAELAASPEMKQLVLAMVVNPEHQRVRQTLADAQRRGQIREDLDLDLAVDAFTGTALARVILLDRPVDHAYGDRLVNLIMYGLTPR